MTPSFPTTTEAFADCQTQITGTTVGQKMREAIDAWVPVFNAAYEDGLRDNTQRLHQLLEALDECKVQTTSAAVLHFLDAAMEWVSLAWAQGQERSKSA